MNAPPTPKTHNGKRRVLATTSPQVDLLDCQSLQRSLKRMKVTSASPGELRLQRDLKHAILAQGWQPHHCHHSWKINNSLVLRQSVEDPLQLVLENNDTAIAWLDIPRLYPHRPPVVQTANKTRVVFQAAPDDTKALEAARNGAYLIRDWTPLLRLHETIQLILPALEHRPLHHVGMHEDEFSIRPRSEADCATEIAVVEMDDGSGGDELFPPNRFNLGYSQYDDRAAIMTSTMMQD